MPNVAEIIREHVTLDIKCVDRLYLNGYVPRLQSEGGVVAFLRQAGGRVIPSPAVFGEITTSFRTRLRAWCEVRGIPWIEFRKGERKDDLVQKYRDRFPAASGVVLVGVAQERAWAWTARKRQRRPWVHFTWQRSSVYVNHYYIYVIDREWGPAFIKVCGYAPYALKLCLNGHEWAKRQAQRRRLRFTALDNGFLDGANPAALQALCDRLSAADIEAFFEWPTPARGGAVAGRGGRPVHGPADGVRPAPAGAQGLGAPRRRQALLHRDVPRAAHCAVPDQSPCEGLAVSWFSVKMTAVGGVLRRLEDPPSSQSAGGC
jgi:hypothetical protein